MESQPQPTSAQTDIVSPVRKLFFNCRSMDNHPKQLRMVRSQFKRKIIRAGRRFGKTVGAGTLAVEAFGKYHKRVLYATPTADQIKKFWFEVCQACADLIEAGILKKNETEHTIEFPGTECRIRAKTAWNSDTLRGDYADLLILDEWQLMDESAWEDVGAPMLIDNNGDAVFIYTPPSLKSRSVSKATDLRHAAKMYKTAQAEMEQAEKEGRQSRWLALHGTSHENPNLSEEGLAEVTQDMTQLSLRQEIMAEDIDEVPGALWKQTTIDDTRVNMNQVPELEVVVVGVDPSGSSTTEAGIVACGSGNPPLGWLPSKEILALNPDVMHQKHMYVKRDRSLKAPSSRTWASAAVDVYFLESADAILGERNYGGDMVESTIRQVENGDKVVYQDVNATRGKIVRASPVAAATEQGRVHFVGVFAELEGECTSYVPGNPSPNRMDAFVWCGIRLLEGMHLLGVVEALKMLDAAGGDMDKVQTAINVAKIVVGDKTERCPECKCLTVQKLDDSRRKCSECGSEWKKEEPLAVTPGQRGEYLQKQADTRSAAGRGTFGRFGR